MDGWLSEALAIVGKDKAVNIVLRVVAHVLLFVLAVAVFVLGLGIGLALNPAFGTALWIASGAIIVLNIIWIVKAGRAK